MKEQFLFSALNKAKNRVSFGLLLLKFSRVKVKSGYSHVEEGMNV